MPTIVYRKKCQLLGLLCLLLIGVIFQRGLQLSLVDSVGVRIQYHVLPVAVSVLYHGHPHDYTALRAVAIPFQSADAPQQLLKSAVETIINTREVYYWVADDKGFADFAILAFKFFGPKTSSLYLMWFACLTLTTLVFLKSFDSHSWCLGLLSLALIGAYTAVSTLPMVSAGNFLGVQGVDQQPSVGIYEPRFLEVLSMIPVLHFCLFPLCRSFASSRWQIVALLGQTFFFFFLYHARSSLGWQLIAMIVFLSIVFYYRVWRSRKKYVRKVSRFLLPVFALTALFFGLITLSIYKHFSYNPRYFQDMGVRTFWHNALIGVSEPEIAATYELAYGDLEVASAVIKYSQQGVCQSYVTRLDPQGLLNSLGGHGEKNWFIYEDCAKKFYLFLWKEHSFRMAYNYLIINPSKALIILWKISKSAQFSISEAVRDQFSIGWHPLSGIPLAFAIITLIIVNKSFVRRRAPLLTILLILLITSLVPSLLFYPAILTLSGFFVTLTMLCYLFLLLGARASIRWLFAAPTR